MSNVKENEPLEIWGGIECSINRVGNNYMDQNELSGHYSREDDIERFAELGIKAMRYPVLWEKHLPRKNQEIDWSHCRKNLQKLRELGIKPIAGLVHHGSGPNYTSFYNGSFEEGLAEFAAKVALQFPWLEYYTPINEPLTTARFCGLYGHWYPHGKDTTSFLKVLFSESKATVLAMQAIRKVNPRAKLVFTEDLTRTHSTETLKYQADFENQRRWLSIDLICGQVNSKHPLFDYILHAGITEKEIAFFQENPCPPGILGFNHYITSERFIDEAKEDYPGHTWGGNGTHNYADVEAVRVGDAQLAGAYQLLKEAWQRYHIPLAVTEVHLHCTREEQLRWFHGIWEAATRLKLEGVNIKGITAWALLGSFDWCSLLTQQRGQYEPGVFDVRSLTPRQTALTNLIKCLAAGKSFDHPVLLNKGWWERPCRIQYRSGKQVISRRPEKKTSKPVIIIDQSGNVGKEFSWICELRGLHYKVLSPQALEAFCSSGMPGIIKAYNPWAVIDAAGFAGASKVQDYYLPENSHELCDMAIQCKEAGVKFVSFSSNLSFGAKQNDPYRETYPERTLKGHGQAKVVSEQRVISANPEALIIRTNVLLGPWDSYNFIAKDAHALKNNSPFAVPANIIISADQYPDLINTSLDLLIDDECGIWNLSNNREVPETMSAEQVA